MELYNSFAFLEMGNLYFHGHGVEKDYKKAIVYYKKSKTSYGLCLIGLVYTQGTEKNYKKAKKYYEKASLLSNSAALNNLGLLYDGGLGVKQDYLKAKEFFEKSAELNNSSGLNNLGVLYSKGQGVEKDYIKAKKYFEESSSLGNSFAFANLGDLYYSGHGVKQDYLKAKECYEKASKLNNSYSTNILGILYENNLGVSQDYFTARKYYDKASKLENSDALNNLGNLYYYGHGVEQDYLKAKDYFEQSSELNNSNAFVNLGNLYYYGNGVKQDYFKAKEFYEKSSKFNNLYAFVNLGILYYYGRGVKQDYFKAKEYFKISSKTSAALFYLGDLYSMENSMDFDLSKAILYFLKSINAKSGIITSYNDIDSSFNVRFESNNYRNISFNNLALIYIFVFNDLEKGEKYLKESAFAEYPFGQNNLGLFFQFYLNKTYDAEYMFSRSSKHNFSLAEFNLAHIREEENKINESIKYYILASEHEDEPLTYHNITHYDKRLEISKTFIICFTNLKLVEYYFLDGKYDEAKKYFNKAFKKLKIINDNHNKKLIFNIRIKTKLFSYDMFSYLKFYILNFPLFNLINQTDLNLDQTIFQKDFQMEINDNKKDIKMKKPDYDIQAIKNLSKLNLPNKENNKVITKKDNYFYEGQNENKNERIFEENNKRAIKDNRERVVENIKEKVIKDIKEIVFEENNGRVIKDNKERVIEENNERVIEYSNERVFNDPNILFDFVIENSCSDSNIKTIFINEIKSIIDIMKSILYNPPYSILFGRISLDNRKSQNVKREKSINIDINFYEGFGI